MVGPGDEANAIYNLVTFRTVPERTGVKFTVSCTTSLISVTFERVDNPLPDNTLTILYTCELHNGTKVRVTCSR